MAPITALAEQITMAMFARTDVDICVKHGTSQIGSNIHLSDDSNQDARVHFFSAPRRTGFEQSAKSGLIRRFNSEQTDDPFDPNPSPNLPLRACGAGHGSPARSPRPTNGSRPNPVPQCPPFRRLLEGVQRAPMAIAHTRLIGTSAGARVHAFSR